MSNLKDGFLYTGDKGPKFGKRHIQIILTATGSGINLSTKSMLSLLLVAMTSEQQSSNPNIPVYDWDNKSVIISAILWTSMFFQLISGHLGKEYGSKWLILAASALNAFGFCMIPSAAAIGGATGVIICRLLQGAAQGSYGPLTANIGGAWVPVEERSRMGYIGSIGITGSVIITTILTGILAKSSIGWPGTIYIFGGLNFVWAACWSFFGYNRPATHPTVTPEEKKYIQVSLNQEHLKAIPTPWVKIFTSVYVWAIIISQIGSGFMLNLLQTENSIFLASALGFDIQTNAVIGALPTCLSLFSGVGFAFLSDYLITKKIMRIVNARRTFHLVGIVGGGVCLFLSACIPVEHRNWVVVIMCLETMFVVACMAGGGDISGYDLSPLFASIIYGVAGALSDAVGLFAPLLVQWVVLDETNEAQWRIVFLIAALVGSVTGLIFVIFTTDERQDWGDLDAPQPDIRRQSIISIEHAVGMKS